MRSPLLFVALLSLSSAAHADGGVVGLIKRAFGQGKPAAPAACSPIEVPPPENQTEERGEAPSAPPPQQNSFQQQSSAPCNDPQLLQMLEMRRLQDSFLRTQARTDSLARADLLLIRLAPMVKNRYLQIAQPAKPLGRLVARPICMMSQSASLTSDGSHLPELRSCRFTFETSISDSPNASFSRNTTTLVADIIVHLEMDRENRTRPSRLRHPDFPAARYQAVLTSEPAVFTAFPANLAPLLPPIPVSDAAVAAASTGEIPLSQMSPLERASINLKAMREEIARRAIQAHESTRVSTVRESVDPSGISDPCGETEPLFQRFVPPFTRADLEERCYVYTTRPLLPGSGDQGFNGQLRLLFQKNSATGKILGIRAFSFGGNL
jgi:hypothetical protein